MNPSARLTIPLLACIFAATIPASGFETASLFSDHMVLQREMEVPVWGTAEAGSEITVTFAEQTVSGKADGAGNWRVTLAPMKASAEGRVMTVASGDSKTDISDVLVGEVWVGSGQSNMAGKVASYAKRDETLAALLAQAPFPEIRLMNGGPKPVWHEATPENVPGFSAILFAFGERLQRDLEVPVGLIVGAVGGTPSGSWMPVEVYDASELCRKEIAGFAKSWDRERAMKLNAEKVAVWEKRAAEAKARGEKPKGRKPGPPKEPGEMSRGGEIGGLFERFIRPVSGYAIRGVLWDQGEAGSGIVGLGQDTSMTELIRGWRAVWGQGEFPFVFVQKPSGGGNAFSDDDPITREAEAFGALPDITRIGDGAGRFLYTRLMRDNANAWMVPAIDLGPMVHPINKWGYGNRAAQVAEQKVYKIPDVQAYGPIYASHRIDGDTLTVRFTEAADGLTARHADEIQGFALAGDDGQWHWAKARIAGEDSIALTCEAVPEPKHVRYAWAKNRTWANLFNQAGLPALAFTTEPKK